MYWNYIALYCIVELLEVYLCMGCVVELTNFVLHDVVVVVLGMCSIETSDRGQDVLEWKYKRLQPGYSNSKYKYYWDIILVNIMNWNTDKQTNKGLGFAFIEWYNKVLNSYKNVYLQVKQSMQ